MQAEFTSDGFEYIAAGQMLNRESPTLAAPGQPWGIPKSWPEDKAVGSRCHMQGYSVLCHMVNDSDQKQRKDWKRVM